MRDKELLMAGRNITLFCEDNNIIIEYFGYTDSIKSKILIALIINGLSFKLSYQTGNYENILDNIYDIIKPDIDILIGMSKKKIF